MSARLSVITLVTGLALAGPAFAQDDAEEQGPFGGSLALSLLSDYVSRGITQTDSRPTVQGTLEGTWDTGVFGTTLYANLFASNVRFIGEGDASSKAFAKREFDYGVGARFATSGITWDFGFLYYDYDNRRNVNYDYWEAQAIIGYDFGVAAVQLKALVTPQGTADTRGAQYLVGTVTVPLPYAFSASGSFGRQWYDKNAYTTQGAGLPDYNHWSVGLQRELYWGVGAVVQYHDTNLSRSKIVRQNGGTKGSQVDQRIVFGLTKTFQF